MRGLVMTASLGLVLTLALAPGARADASEYGLASLEASLSTYQAGAHPDFSLNVGVREDPTTPTNPVGLHDSYAATRDIVVELPPGLIGNPNAVGECSFQQLTEWNLGSGCPNDSQVGITVVYAYALSRAFVEPVYLMQRPEDGDTVARLGFIAGLFPTFINAHVRSSGDYGVTAEVGPVNGQQRLIKAETTLWGVPAAAQHDTERQTASEAFEGITESPPRHPDRAPAPFMINPTRCGVPLRVVAAADSYQQQGVFSSAEAAMPAIHGCDALVFSPALEVRPTSLRAAEPTGLDANLTLPQNETVEGNATAALRRAVVTLPKGMTVAAGAAAGLTACSDAQVGLGGEGPAACPSSSKIGTARFISPALSEPVQGFIYQREPETGHLLRIWLVVDDLGLHLKIPGNVETDPVSGQLTSIFSDTPQLPVESISLDFRDGARAPLANPSTCGLYLTDYVLEPWSETDARSGESPMQIDEDCDTGGFVPRLSAGTVGPAAGSFSPLVTTITQESGEANLSGLEIAMPPGVLAKIAGVPLCPDAQALTGECPVGSQVGTTTVAAGPGPAPLWIPQPGKNPTAVYLAGPYEGGPYSLVVKTPAQAGPFDLGNVVVRVAIHVDPETAKVSVKSDPLPQILEGVPISYRTIHVDVSRSEFALNPTSCKPMAVTGTATSISGQTAGLSDRFQVGSCASLGFKPKLSMRLAGKTHRGAFPAFHAVLKMPKGGANIARALVRLPHSEFLENAHIRTICTRVQFAAESCPEKSIYGRAVAKTPLLDQPLRGPVYLRSSSHELPDLVADLRGQIHVVLDGRIDSIHGGIRSVFEAVPDAPVSQFKIDMQGGSKGLLVNSTGLCHAPHLSVTSFKAQNGRLQNARVPLVAECGKGGKGRRH
jgi:hypothetical protein